jgi:O-antigen ligase
MSLSSRDDLLPFEVASRRCLLLLLITIPLLFGATHPFIQGVYTFLLLIGCGGWLLFGVAGQRRSGRRRVSRVGNFPAEGERRRPLFTGWHWPAVMLLVFAALTTLPLPLGLVSLLSPVRAAYVAAVNALAGGHIDFASLSYSRLLTFKQGAFYLGLLLYFFAALILLRRNREFVLKVATVMVAVGCCEAVYGLLQVVNGHLGVLWLPSDLGAAGVARGTIIYRNQYASFLNLCWPLAVAVAAMKAKKHPVPLFLFAAGLMLLAVLFSLSRGGTIALIIVGAIIGWHAPYKRRQKLAVGAGILLFLIFYGALLGGYDELFRRFFDLRDSAGDRWTVWRYSLPMLFDHPLTGIGLESYRKLSPFYLKNFSGNLLWDRAHNEYLEFAIELGIPAFLLFMGWLAGGLAAGVKLILRRKSSILAIAAFAGIIGFFAHGLTDFGWRLPANCVYCVTLMALAAAEIYRVGRPKGRKIKILASEKDHAAG